MRVVVTGQALIQRRLSGSGTPDRVSEILRDCDIAFANFEVAGEAPGAWATKVKTVHAAPAEAMHALAALGVNALGHANNHAFDLGPPGIAAAHAAAAAAGLPLAGSGRDAEEAGRAVIAQTPRGRVAILAADLGPQPEIVYAGPGRAGINRLRMRRVVSVPSATLAMLSALVEELGDGALQRSRAAVGYRGDMPESGIELFGTAVVAGDTTASRMVPDAGDLAALSARIAGARARAERVLVCLHSHHWKADWGDMPDWFMDLGRTLVEKGADLVVGHGVPVLQRIAFHERRPIFGSLGNFVFHTERAATYDRERPEVWDGALCRCRFGDGGECEAIEVLPVAVGRPEMDAGGLSPAPAVLKGAAASRVMERLTAGLSGTDREKVRLVG
jgi:poly-gamma-glutamate synthesis protein (capsule biosynthesis protein)